MTRASVHLNWTNRRSMLKERHTAMVDSCKCDDYCLALY